MLSCTDGPTRIPSSYPRGHRHARDDSQVLHEALRARPRQPGLGHAPSTIYIWASSSWHDGLMAAPTIWISLENNHVETNGTHPGDHWEEVGVIDSSTETDFYSHIQLAIGVRRTAKGRPDFYMSGDPKSRWVQQCEMTALIEIPQ